MKALALLLLLLPLYSEAKSVCTYVYNCAHCVVDVSTDPPIKIQTTDIACMDRLKTDQTFIYDVPRNRNNFDKSPLSMSQTNYSSLAASILVQSINQSYEDYQQRQQVENFYQQLPDILENRHQELKDQHLREESLRNEKKPFDLAAMNDEVAKLNQSIAKHTIHSDSSTSPIPVPEMVKDLGLKQQLKDIEDQLISEGLHGGFPNLSGKTISDDGGRERRKNSNIQDQEKRRLHSQMLDYADKFRNSSSKDLSKNLQNEAQSLRRGSFKEENSLLSRVQAFELSQSYLQDKRHALNEKIEKETVPSLKNKLETIHDISGKLAGEGQNSFYNGDLAEGEHWTDLATQIVDIGLGFIPGISTGRDLLEAVTGENVITGMKLEVWERGLCAMSAATLGVGSLARTSVKVIDTLSAALIQSNKIGATEVLPKILLQKESRLFRTFKDRDWKSADELNELHRIENGYSLEKHIQPWVKGRRVIEFTSTEETTMYRVFSSEAALDMTSNAAEATGRWLMRIDPRTMSKDEIRKIYALSPKNDIGQAVIVKIPAGTRMRMGVVGHGKDGSLGGAIQYNLNADIISNWIVGIDKL
ncbi:MAG: pre-toxin TG domain-containing protein [Bacteriovoracaceae bacterium]|nr:pre-toxin TG domain-containing protein [Bacteriovoracaceae bacterium]